jgi:tetratricopeptide (TPR) repeat protein
MGQQETQSDFTRATKYLYANKYEKAEQIYRRIIKDLPCKEIHLNLGNCYRAMGQEYKASQHYLKANDPNVPFSNGSFLTEPYPEALNNLGLIAAAADENDDAVVLYQKAIEISKKTGTVHWNAVWNLANARLKQVYSKKWDYAISAWELYESRFKKTPPVDLYVDVPNIPVWTGFENVKHLVVLSEQGIGDKIMVGRYLQYLPEFAKRITIQCPVELNTLFKGYETCLHVSDVGKPTAMIPFCSLVRLFHERMPSDTWMADRYVPKVPNGVLDIGIVYSGSKTHANNIIRTSLPGYFKKLEKYGNIYTINPIEHGKLGFKSMGNKTWDDTIAAMSKLDLVISIDTSVVHLCGSLGMPCWMIQPLRMTDFRWGDNSMGYSNMWYNSVRVFRNPNSWERVFSKVEEELSAYSKQTRS